jgi:acetylglutamate kinase
MLEMTKDIIEQFPEASRLKDKRVLVKYGGAAMESEETKERVCREIAALVDIGARLVVVHGGGKEISHWMERIGLQPHFVNGLRVTDDESMLVTEMVLSGLINSDLVSRLNRLQTRAIGISGRHGRLLQSVPLRLKNVGDLGRTGEVERTNVSILTTLLDAHMTPVVSPVGETIEGVSLNLNADYAAAALAGAWEADVCVFLTDVDGVKLGNSLLPTVTKEQISSMIEEGSLYGGMIPKVECALRALNDGCKRAVITAAQRPYSVTRALLEVQGCCTSFVNSSES